MWPPLVRSPAAYLTPGFLRGSDSIVCIQQKALECGLVRRGRLASKACHVARAQLGAAAVGMWRCRSGVDPPHMTTCALLGLRRVQGADPVATTVAARSSRKATRPVWTRVFVPRVGSS